MSRYRGTLRIEVDIDGDFESYEAFDKAVEDMWNDISFYEAGLKYQLNAEDNWIELDSNKEEDE